ncbi:MAG TPA: hypothetical protein VFE86_05160 [Ilumatobacteraceae bacterium]|jgi:hypothetical protein|nr:hypothetical protein [Ilumatobacteraceae bacterium]
MAEPDDEAIEPSPSFDPVRAARRRHGAAGAIVAAGMFGLDQALGRKPKEEAPIVMAAADEPVDIDQEGIVVPVDSSTSVVAPPQPRSDPLPGRRRRKRR